MTVDGASLDAGSGTITLKELVSNTTLSASRSGSNILFSDTLTGGETALYEITVASGCDATYGDLNQDGRADATDLVILSNYLVGNLTQGSVPFTAPLAKADLDRSGAVNAVDLVVLQNYLAGNLACLPK
ncbi:MAG: dockerin type I repeat-containing protein [Thermoanaerobaculia bacterium]